MAKEKKGKSTWWGGSFFDAVFGRERTDDLHRLITGRKPPARTAELMPGIYEDTIANWGKNSAQKKGRQPPVDGWVKAKTFKAPPPPPPDDSPPPGPPSFFDQYPDPNAAIEALIDEENLARTVDSLIAEEVAGIDARTQRFQNLIDAAAKTRDEDLARASTERAAIGAEMDQRAAESQRFLTELEANRRAEIVPGSPIPQTQPAPDSPIPQPATTRQQDIDSETRARRDMAALRAQEAEELSRQSARSMQAADANLLSASRGEADKVRASRGRRMEEARRLARAEARQQVSTRLQWEQARQQSELAERQMTLKEQAEGDPVSVGDQIKVHELQERLEQGQRSALSDATKAMDAYGAWEDAGEPDNVDKILDTLDADADADAIGLFLAMRNASARGASPRDALEMAMNGMVTKDGSSPYGQFGIDAALGEFDNWRGQVERSAAARKMLDKLGGG